MIPEAISDLVSTALLKTGSRQISSQITAPVTRYTGSTGRPSKTRVPVHVTAKAVNSSAFDRSMEMRSGADPYTPNSVTDAARNKWAKPHHATAVIAVFYTQANSSKRPRMAST